MNIEIKYVYREANKCADMLVKIGHRLPLGLVFYDRLTPYIFVGSFVDFVEHYNPCFVIV